MKIGIFASGLGGLMISKALREKLPQYDYIYLGDTKNLPYGNKSQQTIYKNTVRAVRYLFDKNCVLVILACNTASSKALRKIQTQWLPKSKYKDRKVLGVIRPTVESVVKSTKIGLIGTIRTIDSSAYLQELKKINKNIKLVAKATPKLVPMIEKGEYKEEILKNYLLPFKNIETLILGCTHYGILKEKVRKILGPKVKIIVQEDILPYKLKNYLSRHKDIVRKLSKNRTIEILVTKNTKSIKKFSPKLVHL